jgi:hypothetical protein
MTMFTAGNGPGRPPPTDIGLAIDRLADRMEAIERRLEAIQVGRLDKEWYTTEEVAALMDRAPWTVREWARHGRMNARKRPGTDRWVVSRQELDRLLNEGLLPAKE